MGDFHELCVLGHLATRLRAQTDGNPPRKMRMRANSVNRRLPHFVARVNPRAFRATTLARNPEVVLRNYFCADRIRGRREGVSSRMPDTGAPSLRILEVHPIKNPARGMRPRAINSKQDIIRRPGQDRETQGEVRVVVVNSKVSIAIPPHEAMACAKYLLALLFIIPGGCTGPLWTGGIQIIARALWGVYVGHGHITSIDASRFKHGAHRNRWGGQGQGTLVRRRYHLISGRSPENSPISQSNRVNRL